MRVCLCKKNDGIVENSERHSQHFTVDGLITLTQLNYEFRIYRYTWVLSNLTFFS